MLERITVNPSAKIIEVKQSLAAIKNFECAHTSSSQKILGISASLSFEVFICARSNIAETKKYSDQGIVLKKQ